MRVLVVEDEVSLAETIRDGLTEAGFVVDIVHNGVDGLWQAQETPHGAYDVLVLDIMLPGLSGYEVCRTLRRHKVWTPILMLTAKDGAPERPTVLAAGDLSLDPGERRVWRGQEAIAVTPREFAMLEFLMRNRGQAMTKRAILENVWDAHFSGDPNIVEVYIGYLRKKIDHPFGRAALETVRGAGYRLDAEGG